MAKENKNKVKAVLALDSIVNSNIEAFVNSRNTLRAQRSAELYQKAVDEGQDAGEQIAFLQGWLKEEQGKRVPDRAFIRELKKDITDMKKIERSNKFYDKYRESFETYKLGKKSIDEHISYLQNQQKTVTDPSLRREIDGLLTTARTEKMTMERTILENKVTLAMNDKRESVLNDAISRVKSAKQKALAGGNDQWASALDIRLQSLNSQLQNTKITDAVHDIETEMLGKDYKPTEFLKKLQSKMSLADASNTPITIDGQRYDNAKQFWQFQTNKYVEESFFTMLAEDNKARIDTANMELTPKLEAEFRKQYEEMERLKMDPTLAPYVEKIEQMQISNASYAVNMIGKKIVRDYQDGKMGESAKANINNTIARLTELNKTYGVDVSANIDAVVQDVASKKQAISEAQMQVYQNAIAAGKTPEEAFKEAEANVSGVDIPTSEYIEKSPLEITKEKASALDTAGTEGESKFEISGQKTEMDQPKVSGEAPKPAQLGELIPYKELLNLVKEQDIERKGQQIYLKQGVEAPFKKISNEEELKGLSEEQLVRPEGSTDIFLKQ